MVEKKRVSTPLREPNNCTSDRRPQRRSSRARSASSSSSKHTMPPVPAAVMMCERAKLVRLMSARAPVGVPRSVSPRASHESSTTLRPWRSAMSRIASQSGALPMRFGARIALVRGPIIASMPSTSIWKVSGVTSTNAGTTPARTSGAMSVENVTAAVTISSPGSSPSTSTARYSAELPELHIIPRRLANSSATPGLHRLDVLADAQGGGSAPQHLDHGLDLVLVVHGARVVDAAWTGLTPLTPRLPA